MNSIPDQEPRSSALALHRGQKMTLPRDLARHMQDGGKQDKTDTMADRGVQGNNEMQLSKLKSNMLSSQ